MKLIPKQDYVLYYLLAAWRGKLNDEEWESRIRKVLPRGVNGDVYDLADCLLKQALVGPVPNQLFISYLKHAVKCELVSHGAVLSSISNQNINIRLNSHSSGRTWPLICLLEFLRSFRDKISCKGTEIECLNLCLSMSQLIFWLLKCVRDSIDFIIGASSSPTNTSSSISSTVPTTTAASNLPGNINSSNAPNIGTSTIPSQMMGNLTANSSAQLINCNESILEIIDLCTETIHYFIDRPFTKSLLFISKLEYKQDFEEIPKTIQSIRQKLKSFPALNSLHDKIKYFKILHELDFTFSSPRFHPAMVAAQQLRCIQMHRIRSTQIVVNNNLEKRMQISDTSLIRDSSINYALFNSLYPLVAFYVTLRPARSHKQLAEQIATITNFHSAHIGITYCELIRASMIGLIDTDGTPAKQNWGFFTFLKLPKLLLELNNVYKKQTLNLPMQHKSSHLDSNITAQTNNNFISDLKLAFERLCEYSPLLDEAEYKCNCDLFKCLVKELIKNDSSLIQLKSVDFRKLSARRSVTLNNDDTASGYMVLKAEPVVTSMLATFDSEQDPAAMYSLLTSLVSGKQFEFTLGIAASTGRLDMFIRKLVKHNELNRLQQQCETAPSDLQTHALIFDITFLMLTYIAQQYGPSVIAYDQNSTFSKWFYDCYNPETRINCPKEMLKNCNDEIVTNLIKQLVHPKQSIQLESVDWVDVCTNIPKAMSEIINAWMQGYIGEETIKIVIDKIKSKMCSLAVITATWLQSYIRTLTDSDRAKPLSILQNLTKTSPKQHQQPSSESTGSSTNNESYTERSSLMCSIIRKIYFVLVPKTNQSPQTATSTTANGANSSDNNLPTSNTDTSSDDPTNSNETSCKSTNDRFISTLSTQEIFLANVKHCLNKGWIDQRSLNSLNSLFKMIGSNCFTNLIIDHILTSHESPSDLSRAVNITFGLFHLDIESCAFTLLRDTVPRWLMKERKQVFLNQPRAFALANLTVMTIIEVYNNLKAATNQTPSAGYQQPNSASATATSTSTTTTVLSGGMQFGVNGIKQEPGVSSQPATAAVGTSATGQAGGSSSANKPMDVDSKVGGNNSNGPKRIKLDKESTNLTKSATTTFGSTASNSSDSISREAAQERLNALNTCLADLMKLFKDIMADRVMSQRTLFPILFLQQTVVCARENSDIITVHLQPEILLDIINSFSSELTFELVLAMSNLSTTNSRKYAAKAMCNLDQVKESLKLASPATAAPATATVAPSVSSSSSSSNTPHHPMTGNDSSNLTGGAGSSSASQAVSTGMMAPQAFVASLSATPSQQQQQQQQHQQQQQPQQQQHLQQHQPTSS